MEVLFKLNFPASLGVTVLVLGQSFQGFQTLDSQVVAELGRNNRGGHSTTWLLNEPKPNLKLYRQYKGNHFRFEYANNLTYKCAEIIAL
jgi:hypothetical protein